jgi:hypothetical protein
MMTEHLMSEDEVSWLRFGLEMLIENNPDDDTELQQIDDKLLMLNDLVESEWCEEHHSGFNWHNNGPRCDAYRLMATPGWHTGTKPCRPTKAYVKATSDG